VVTDPALDRWREELIGSGVLIVCGDDDLLSYRLRSTGIEKFEHLLEVVAARMATNATSDRAWLELIGDGALIGRQDGEPSSSRPRFVGKEWPEHLLEAVVARVATDTSLDMGGKS